MTCKPASEQSNNLNKELSYRPDIDGLRAIAVLAVIGFHLQLDWLQGGYLGVDIFFVISGYLITSIIFPKILQRDFSIVAFWKRRFKRLFPALACMVGVVLVVGALIQVRPERDALPSHALAAIFSFANILMWKTTGGYWDTSSDNIALLHTWSLSLEEQFYVLFPLLLIVSARISKRHVVWILGGVFCISAVACWYGTIHSPNASFYLLPTRIWEFLFGGILAILQIERPQQRADSDTKGYVATLIGLTAIIGSLMGIDKNASFPGLWPAIPCLGTVLVLQFGNSSGTLRTILGSRVATYVGRISYSLYLWHWPIIVFLGYSGTANAFGIACVLTFLFGVTSYHFIESPLRYRQASTWPVAFAAISLLAICGLPSLLLKSSPLLGEFGKQLDADAALTQGWEFEATELLRSGQAGVTICGTAESTDICIAGSSHARVLCAALGQYARPRGLTALSFATSGIEITGFSPVAREEIASINENRMRLIEETHPKIVIVAAKWYTQYRFDGFETSLKRQLERLSKAADHVLVLGQPPIVKLPGTHPAVFRKHLVSRYYQGETLTVFPLLDSTQANASVRACVQSLRSQKIVYLDLDDLFVGPDGRIEIVQSNAILFSDSHHLNDFGAEIVLQKRLRPILDSLLEIGYEGK